jgi:hypothetical protein
MSGRLNLIIRIFPADAAGVKDDGVNLGSRNIASSAASPIFKKVTANQGALARTNDLSDKGSIAWGDFMA